MDGKYCTWCKEANVETPAERQVLGAGEPLFLCQMHYSRIERAVDNAHRNVGAAARQRRARNENREAIRAEVAAILADAKRRVNEAWAQHGLKRPPGRPRPSKGAEAGGNGSEIPEGDRPTAPAPPPPKPAEPVPVHAKARNAKARSASYEAPAGA